MLKSRPEDAGTPRLSQRARSRAASVVVGDDVPELSAAQMRELERRVADSRDPTRYLLASTFGPRFVLYYDLTDDVYAHNDPRQATLFKRRSVALAVRRLLGRGVKIVRCSSRVEEGRRVPVFARGRPHAPGAPRRAVPFRLPRQSGWADPARA
jgi:hypothetical protein